MSFTPRHKHIDTITIVLCDVGAECIHNYDEDRKEDKHSGPDRTSSRIFSTQIIT